MRIRNVLKEFEAHLHPIQSGTRTQGKSEWKQYGDGTYRFKISIRDISLPDGSRVDSMLDDVRVMQLIVQNNKAKVDVENETRIGIPNVQAGQVLRIKFGETILAEGVYVVE